MNINDFVQNNAAGKYLGTGANAPKASRLDSSTQAALGKADKRIQSSVDATTAQLSSVGKLKSSVSDVQAASLNLQRLDKDSTALSEKAAVSNFVSAFNAAIKTAKTTAETPGEGLAAKSSLRAGRELQKAVGSDATTLESLKALGVSQKADGSLALDTQKLDAKQKTDANGVRATLNQLGKSVNATATNTLAASGNVGLSISYLNLRADALKTQQTLVASAGFNLGGYR
ncbi:MAG: hypothetical protein CFE43_11420 [Burkholderiales bacterium PBB3]|nr:MAG: hypothetical protein CFE43_11420 [Burkholderiales bacterium PBB3]